MRVLIATDVFPPKCSGSGWSAYYLSRELRKLGHEITVARPRFVDGDGKPKVVRSEYDGLPVAELHIPSGGSAPAKLLTRNVTAPHLLQRFIADETRRSGASLIHAQHMWTTPAAVGAAHSTRLGLATRVVSTVRDYWPISHFTTMHLPTRYPLSPGVPCPDCGTLSGLAGGLLRAQGVRGLAQWPVAPIWHMLALRRRAALRQADATIAVSNYVGQILLREKAVDQSKLHIVPNLVDVDRVAEIIAVDPPYERLGLKPNDPFLLFAGKLDPHKGAQLLPTALQAASVGRSIPLVLAGEGPLAERIRGDGAEKNLDLRMADWLTNDEVLRLMSRCTLLLVPSVWQEPLSRVLLEGSAAGAAILALDTGGTPDAIVNGVTGSLAADMDDFARRLTALLGDETERDRLGRGALANAREKFDGAVVARRVEAIYQRLLPSWREPIPF